MSGYAKLFSSILHSTIWLEPDHIRLVWITMLAMADRHGLVETSVPGLAVAARVTMAQCEEAIARLKQPDAHSRTKEFEGRRIEDADGGFLVLTYEIHRGRASAASKRENRAERQARWRERKRLGLVGSDSSEEPVDANASPPIYIEHASGSGSGSGSCSSDLDLDPDPEHAPRQPRQVPPRPPQPPIEPEVKDTLEVELDDQERAQMHLDNPTEARLVLQPPEDDPAVRALCQLWADVWGVSVRLRGGMNDPRLQAILGRLAEGFELGQLEAAIRGSRNDTFVKTRKALQSLKTVLRDADAVDKYARLVDGEEEPADTPARLTGVNAALAAVTVED